MARKTVTSLNIEKGRFCTGCSFGYQSFSSKEEMTEFLKDDPERYEANRCGSKIRKKSHIPKDKTCEHWSNTRDTYGADFRAENKLSDKKSEEEESEEKEDEVAV